jgi:6-phosphofructokinase 1
VVEADYERILNFFWAHQVRYFVHIGGNGSMYVTQRLAEVAEARRYALSVIGVPKTIDNDLNGTDHSPGYGSAARFLALAARDTGRDLESMVNFDDVIILETMGRNAGWLAAAAALGKESEDEAPHLVYVPEIVFDKARFLEAVARIHSRLGRVFVVVAEGIRDQQGDFVGQYYQTDPLGRIVHAWGTGVAAYLTDRVREQLKLQTRFLRPGLIGRASSACVSAIDREEAYRAGQAAVEQLVGGQSGLMIALERRSDQPYSCQTGTTPLAEVTALEKTMPRAYMDEAGTMITEAFRRYALPLIGEPLRPLVRLRK